MSWRWTKLGAERCWSVTPCAHQGIAYMLGGCFHSGPERNCRSVQLQGAVYILFCSCPRAPQALCHLICCGRCELPGRCCAGLRSVHTGVASALNVIAWHLESQWHGEHLHQMWFRKVSFQKLSSNGAPEAGEENVRVVLSVRHPGTVQTQNQLCLAYDHSICQRSIMPESVFYEQLSEFCLSVTLNLPQNPPALWSSCVVLNPLELLACLTLYKQPGCMVKWCQGLQ